MSLTDRVRMCSGRYDIVYQGTKYRIVRGETFGALTVVARDYSPCFDVNGKVRSHLICICRCLSVGSFFVSDLLSGKSFRCGKCGFYDENSPLRHEDPPFIAKAKTELRLHPIYSGVWCGRDGSIWSGWIGRGESRRNVHYPVRALKCVTAVNGYVDVGIPLPYGFTAKQHVLIAEAWHGLKPQWADSVRHLNGIRDDNRASNLSWGTAKEQAEDKRRHGSMPRRLSETDKLILVKDIPLWIQDSEAVRQFREIKGDDSIEYDVVRRFRRRERKVRSLARS